MCAAPKSLEERAAHHGTPQPPGTKGCESRRRLVRIVPPIYGLWHCYTHTNCICNDTIACVNRVIGKVPLPNEVGLRRLRYGVRHVFTPRIMAPLTLVEACATFKGTKNKLYKRALESLSLEPLSQRDARIKAFVKAERFNPEDKVNPDPRMIQARDPRYNLHLARYLRSVEHLVYGALDVFGLPIIVKCKNPLQRAELLLAKWELFTDPVCFSLDCSRWDKHVALDVLRVEHKFYRACYPGDAELNQLLKWQEKNSCVTSNGLRYKVVGGRMSGDMNTALGNCLLAVGMVYGAMFALGIKQFSVLDDGDDCLVIVERSDFERANARLPAIFLDYGQELKIENVACEPQGVVFCQSKLTWNGDQYTFARNWRKVLSQACTGTKHWNDPFMVRPMFGLLGDCEMAQHRGIPILQAFAVRLRQLSGGLRSSMAHMDSSYQYRIAQYQLDDIANIKSRIITDRARVEFEKTWGVSPSEQIAIEKALFRWDPSEFYRDVGPEYDKNWGPHLDPGIPNPTVL